MAVVSGTAKIYQLWIIVRNTWFDRDLGVAGRITLRNGKDGRLAEKLVNIPKYTRLLLLCALNTLKGHT